MYKRPIEPFPEVSIVPALTKFVVVDPSEYIPVELDPIVIFPVFVIIESLVPYNAVEESPIVITPVPLLLITPNFAYIPVELSPDKVIVPLLFNVTLALVAVRFS